MKIHNLQQYVAALKSGSLLFTGETLGKIHQDLGRSHIKNEEDCLLVIKAYPDYALLSLEDPSVQSILTQPNARYFADVIKAAPMHIERLLRDPALLSLVKSASEIAAIVNINPALGKTLLERPEIRALIKSFYELTDIIKVLPATDVETFLQDPSMLALIKSWNDWYGLFSMFSADLRRLLISKSSICSAFLECINEDNLVFFIKKDPLFVDVLLTDDRLESITKPNVLVDIINAVPAQATRLLARLRGQLTLGYLQTLLKVISLQQIKDVLGEDQVVCCIQSEEELNKIVVAAPQETTCLFKHPHIAPIVKSTATHNLPLVLYYAQLEPAQVYNIFFASSAAGAGAGASVSAEMDSTAFLALFTTGTQVAQALAAFAKVGIDARMHFNKLTYLLHELPAVITYLSVAQQFSESDLALILQDLRSQQPALNAVLAQAKKTKLSSLNLQSAQDYFVYAYIVDPMHAFLQTETQVCDIDYAANFYRLAYQKGSDALKAKIIQALNRLAALLQSSEHSAVDHTSFLENTDPDFSASIMAPVLAAGAGSGSSDGTHETPAAHAANFISLVREVTKAELSLLEYPDERALLTKSVEVTLGDLHGNALKFIHFLITEGVMQLSAGDYITAVDTYAALAEKLGVYGGPLYQGETRNEITRLLTDFKAILEKATWCRVPCTVRLIGDELSDRGVSDILTLWVYEKLGQQRHIKVITLLSNHGEDFYYRIAYAKRHHLPLAHVLQSSAITKSMSIGPQMNSAYTTGNLMASGLLSETEVLSLIETYHKPTLKVMDVTCHGNKLVLYTHTPMSMKILLVLANKLGIPQPTSLSSLFTTIEQVNNALYSLPGCEGWNSPYAIFQHVTNNELDPLMQILWFRDRSSPCGDYTFADGTSVEIKYVYGHVGSEAKDNPACFCHVNLDNDLGKGDFKSPSRYSSLRVVKSFASSVVLRPALASADTSSLIETSVVETVILNVPQYISALKAGVLQKRYGDLKRAHAAVGARYVKNKKDFFAVVAAYPAYVSLISPALFSPSSTFGRFFYQDLVEMIWVCPSLEYKDLAHNDLLGELSTQLIQSPSLIKDIRGSYYFRSFISVLPGLNHRLLTNLDFLASNADLTLLVMFIKANPDQAGRLLSRESPLLRLIKDGYELCRVVVALTAEQAQSLLSLFDLKEMIKHMGQLVAFIDRMPAAVASFLLDHLNLSPIVRDEVDHLVTLLQKLPFKVKDLLSLDLSKLIKDQKDLTKVIKVIPSEHAETLLKDSRIQRIVKTTRDMSCFLTCAQAAPRLVYELFFQTNSAGGAGAGAGGSSQINTAPLMVLFTTGAQIVQVLAAFARVGINALRHFQDYLYMIQEASDIALYLAIVRQFDEADVARAVEELKSQQPTLVLTIDRGREESLAITTRVVPVPPPVRVAASASVAAVPCVLPKTAQSAQPHTDSTHVPQSTRGSRASSSAERGRSTPLPVQGKVKKCLQGFLNIFNPSAHTGWKQHVGYGMLATFIVALAAGAVFFSLTTGVLPAVATAATMLHLSTVVAVPIVTAGFAAASAVVVGMCGVVAKGICSLCTGLSKNSSSEREPLLRKNKDKKGVQLSARSSINSQEDSRPGSNAARGAPSAVYHALKGENPAAPPFSGPSFPGYGTVRRADQPGDGPTAANSPRR